MSFPSHDDTSRAGLAELEQALLWSMQAWVVGHCRGTPVASRIGGLFADLGAPQATGYLDGLMWTLSQGATRLLEINCVCCASVSADERLLLDIHALQQEGHAEVVLELLGTMLSPGAALAARSSISRLLATLDEAGHTLAETGAALGRHLLMPPPGRLVMPAPRWMH